MAVDLSNLFCSFVEWYALVTLFVIALICVVVFGLVHLSNPPQWLTRLKARFIMRDADRVMKRIDKINRRRQKERNRRQ